MFVSLINEIRWCNCSNVSLIKCVWLRNGKRKIFSMSTWDMYKWKKCKGVPFWAVRKSELDCYENG